MEQEDTLARQLLGKIVGLLEDVAHQLRGGGSAEDVAGELERYANELRDDLHRGHV